MTSVINFFDNEFSTNQTAVTFLKNKNVIYSIRLCPRCSREMMLTSKNALFELVWMCGRPCRTQFGFLNGIR